MRKPIFEYLNFWSAMSYSENPYGPKIPGIFLYCAELVKTPLTPDAPKCLADLIQNGNSIAYVINDLNKTSKAENIDCVIFSDIFHELFDAGELCPSNYVRVIIDKLDAYNATATDKLSFNDYIGIISRGLRAFASYVRELHLLSLIRRYLYESGKYHYTVFEPNVETDIKEKTDIMFSIGPRLSRVWSYQNTPKGIEKTSRRILKGCSTGYNILLPFDKTKTIYEVEGWFLYNKYVIFLTLDRLLSCRADEYENVKWRIERYGDYVAIPQVFFVP